MKKITKKTFNEKIDTINDPFTLEQKLGLLDVLDSIIQQDYKGDILNTMSHIISDIKNDLKNLELLCDNVSKVYYTVTNNKISKPFVDPSEVISVFEEEYQEVNKEVI